ncbi:uncharacterized protein LOC115232473 [Argonauta hians]
MKSSTDPFIIISDSDSDLDSLPDIPDTSHIIVPQLKQTNSKSEVIVIKDEDPEDIMEITQNDSNHSSSISKIDITAEESELQSQIQQNIIKKCSFTPYLPQSPSLNMIKYGSSLRNQSPLSMKLICSHFEEKTTFANYTSYITDVLSNCKPDHSVSENLFNLLTTITGDKSIKIEESISLSFEISNLLNIICHRYPENIRFIWYELSEIARKNTVSLITLSFIVDISLSVFQSEISKHYPSKSYPTTCEVYKILANEEAHSSVKCIITLLTYCFEILPNNSSNESEILIHKLQKLLDISVCISLKSITMADHIAKQLVNLYNQLPCLKQRIRLMHSIKSELIMFKMVENILVLQYDNISLKWNDIPVTLLSVAECFFQALPKKNIICHSNLNDGIVKTLYQEQSCEELTAILYYTVTSLVLYYQRSSINITASTYLSPIKGLQYHLEGLYSQIELLKIHMNRLNPKLTTNTVFYFNMMDHISDYFNDDVVLSAF